mmetsp:Transcript_3914/g.9858  ORF Transcript_3914/g.9858 Transcript_3914/m.9858 type:complete len:344 (+) Transcript_3914:516-1547(+)
MAPRSPTPLGRPATSWCTPIWPVRTAASGPSSIPARTPFPGSAVATALITRRVGRTRGTHQPRDVALHPLARSVWWQRAPLAASTPRLIADMTRIWTVLRRAMRGGRLARRRTGSRKRATIWVASRSSQTPSAWSTTFSSGDATCQRWRLAAKHAKRSQTAAVSRTIPTARGATSWRTAPSVVRKGETPAEQNLHTPMGASARRLYPIRTQGQRASMRATRLREARPTHRRKTMLMQISMRAASNRDSRQSQQLPPLLPRQNKTMSPYSRHSAQLPPLPRQNSKTSPKSRHSASSLEMSTARAITCMSAPDAKAAASLREAGTAPSRIARPGATSATAARRLP